MELHRKLLGAVGKLPEITGYLHLSNSDYGFQLILQPLDMVPLIPPNWLGDQASASGEVGVIHCAGTL